MLRARSAYRGNGRDGGIDYADAAGLHGGRDAGFLHALQHRFVELAVGIDFPLQDVVVDHLMRPDRRPACFWPYSRRSAASRGGGPCRSHWEMRLRILSASCFRARFQLVDLDLELLHFRVLRGEGGTQFRPSGGEGR